MKRSTGNYSGVPYLRYSLFLLIFICTSTLGGIKKDLQGLECLRSFSYFYVNQNNKSMSKIEEIWKDVVGYEGLYEVSSLGNVRGVDRVIRPEGSEKGMVIWKSRPIKGVYNDRGYRHVRLNRKNKGREFRIARLVAFAFIPNPDNKPFVNHKDGIRDHDVPENLEWCTHLENMRHSWRELGRREKVKRGADNPGSKKVAKISKSGEVIKVYNSCHCAHRDGFNFSCVAAVARRDKGTYKGFKWKYV